MSKPTASSTRKGRLVIPGGIDPHTHMELPFGGTSSSDDFETGTRAAAFGGTTTIIDFAVQYKGQALNQALDAWFKKADGKTSIDYGFHLICTDLPDDRLPEMKSCIDQGVTSFKLFMAYPGVFLVDDATIYKAMMTATEHGGLICMHAENGVVIDAIVKRAIAEGKTAPKYHALTRPTKAEAEGVHRAIALAEIARRARLHRPSQLRRLARGGRARARHGRAGVRGDVSAVSLPRLQRLREAGIRRREVGDDAAHSREVESGEAVARTADERPAGRLDRSLSVLLQGSEGAGQERFLEDSRTAARASSIA